MFKTRPPRGPPLFFLPLPSSPPLLSLFSLLSHSPHPPQPHPHLHPTTKKTQNKTSKSSKYQQIKPDGVQRGLVGEIIGRFERKGFKLTALKLFTPPRSLAEEHYKDLSAKPFFGDLVSYICSGPVVAMVWEGDGVVASARKLIGATNPLAR